jgi:heme-degrading monooxygenase HmoA
MSYVVVEDVAASWEHYRQFEEALSGTAPTGLILHAAGPTDEGFRIVGVWESEAAWHRFAAQLPPEAGSRRQVRRTLQPEHVVYGQRREDTS